MKHEQAYQFEFDGKTYHGLYREYDKCFHLYGQKFIASSCDNIKELVTKD